MPRNDTPENSADNSAQTTNQVTGDSGPAAQDHSQNRQAVESVPGDGTVPNPAENAQNPTDQLAENGVNHNEVDVNQPEMEEEVDEAQNLPNDVLEIDLTHARLRKMSSLHLERFTAIERLALRQNLFKEVCKLPPTLQEVDLYDNLLEHIDAETFNACPRLQSLDLSFNKLKQVPANLDLPELTELFFASNRVSEIPAFTRLRALTNLEFGANRIRKMENLSNLGEALTQLWLGKNKIPRIEGLENCKKLTILSLQSNRITKIEGLDTLTELRELYLAHNGLTKIEGLENQHHLEILEVANNAIVDLENLSHLSKLEEFWANHNKISSFDQVESELGGLENLETVYFEGNPLQKDNPSQYRRKVMLCLKGVKQIDATHARA